MPDEAKAEIKNTVRFCGGNERFWQGVPARDLTEEEWLKLDDELRDTLLQINLYELIEQPIQPASEPDKDPVKASKKKVGD